MQSLKKSLTNVARLGVLALGLTAELALAQVRAIGPEFLPIVQPRYYQATDLGRVAEGKPVGCLSRNGTVAVTRWRWESGSNRWTARAVRPGNTDFAFFYIEGKDSWVGACNDNNEFAGVSIGHGGGVVWDIDWTAGPQRLGSNFVGMNQPSGINNQRQVVGTSADSLGNPVAVAWLTSALPNAPAPTPIVLAHGAATGINANGVASLTSFIGQPTQRRAGLTAVQGGLPYYPSLPGAAISWANGIDDLSRIVGGMRDAAGTTRAFTWQLSEGMVTLSPTYDSQGGLGHADARAIGLDRLVVGQSYALLNGQPVRPAATVWVGSGGPRNLNREASMADGSAPPTLTDAVAVSHGGAILCEARASDGTRRAVLLTPRVGGQWSRFP